MAIKSEDGFYQNTCTCGVVEKDGSMYPCLCSCEFELGAELDNDKCDATLLVNSGLEKTFPENNKYPPNNKF